MISDSVRERKIHMAFVDVVTRRKKMDRKTALMQSSPDLRKESIVIMDMFNDLVGNNNVEETVGIRPGIGYGDGRHTLPPGNARTLACQFLHCMQQVALGLNPMVVHIEAVKL